MDLLPRQPPLPLPHVGADEVEGADEVVGAFVGAALVVGDCETVGATEGASEQYWDCQRYAEDHCETEEDKTTLWVHG